MLRYVCFFVVLGAATAEQSYRENNEVEQMSPCPAGSEPLLNSQKRPQKCLPRQFGLCIHAANQRRLSSADGLCCWYNKVDYYCCLSVAPDKCPAYENVTVVIQKEMPRASAQRLYAIRKVIPSGAVLRNGGLKRGLRSPFLRQPARQNFFDPARPPYQRAGPFTGARDPQRVSTRSNKPLFIIQNLRRRTEPLTNNAVLRFNQELFRQNGPPRYFLPSYIEAPLTSPSAGFDPSKFVDPAARQNLRTWQHQRRRPDARHSQILWNPSTNQYQIATKPRQFIRRPANQFRNNPR